MADELRVVVTVGNATQSFDRFLLWVGEATAAYSGKLSGLCQHGASTVRVSRLENQGTVSKEVFLASLASADVVLCHAGVGTLLEVMACGLVPGVAARLAGSGEIANDHQLEIVEELQTRKLIRVVSNADDILRILNDPPARGVPLQNRPPPDVIVQAVQPRSGARPWGMLAPLALLAPKLEKLRLR